MPPLWAGGRGTRAFRGKRDFSQGLVHHTAWIFGAALASLRRPAGPGHDGGRLSRAVPCTRGKPLPWPAETDAPEAARVQLGACRKPDDAALR